MPLSRLTHTFPLDCAEAISEFDAAPEGAGFSAFFGAAGEAMFVELLVGAGDAAGGAEEDPDAEVAGPSLGSAAFDFFDFFVVVAVGSVPALSLLAAVLVFLDELLAGAASVAVSLPEAAVSVFFDFFDLLDVEVSPAAAALSPSADFALFLNLLAVEVSAVAGAVSPSADFVLFFFDLLDFVPVSAPAAEVSEEAVSVFFFFDLLDLDVVSAVEVSAVLASLALFFDFFEDAELSDVAA